MGRKHFELRLGKVDLLEWFSLLGIDFAGSCVGKGSLGVFGLHID